MSASPGRRHLAKVECPDCDKVLARDDVFMPLTDEEDKQTTQTMERLRALASVHNMQYRHAVYVTVTPLHAVFGTTR